jgi:hypothetical protein
MRFTLSTDQIQPHIGKKWTDTLAALYPDYDFAAATIESAVFRDEEWTLEVSGINSEFVDFVKTMKRIGINISRVDVGTEYGHLTSVLGIPVRVDPTLPPSCYRTVEEVR